MNIVLETGDLERTQKLHYNTTYKSSCRNSCPYRHAIDPQSLSNKYGVVEVELAGQETKTLNGREWPSLRAAQLNLISCDWNLRKQMDR